MATSSRPSALSGRWSSGVALRCNGQQQGVRRRKRRCCPGRPTGCAHGALRRQAVARCRDSGEVSLVLSRPASASAAAIRGRCAPAPAFRPGRGLGDDGPRPPRRSAVYLEVVVSTTTSAGKSIDQQRQPDLDREKIRVDRAAPVQRHPGRVAGCPRGLDHGGGLQRRRHFPGTYRSGLPDLDLNPPRGGSVSRPPAPQRQHP